MEQHFNADYWLINFHNLKKAKDEIKILVLEAWKKDEYKLLE